MGASYVLIVSFFVISEYWMKMTANSMKNTTVSEKQQRLMVAGIREITTNLEVMNCFT
jgi:hypothetical protein